MITQMILHRWRRVIRKWADLLDGNTLLAIHDVQRITFLPILEMMLKNAVYVVGDR